MSIKVKSFPVRKRLIDTRCENENQFYLFINGQQSMMTRMAIMEFSINKSKATATTHSHNVS